MTPAEPLGRKGFRKNARIFIMQGNRQSWSQQSRIDPMRVGKNDTRQSIGAQWLQKKCKNSDNAGK
jgi:hypothetical protein